ncbi:MAG: hypothetical protein M0R77_18850 [Gammaproteobacteria bacterium]|nr:hypothetical protein [Gammaproteobacteria bacterium]
MKNGKVAAIISVMKKHGFVVSSDIAVELLAAIQTRGESEYEIGDFVEIYEGMGECGFGEIVEILGKGRYMINHWDMANQNFSHKSPNSSISGLSSKEEAIDYFLIRTGQKK